MENPVELDWRHKVVDLRDTKRVRRTASEAECAVLSEIFGDAMCRALKTRYEIKPLAPGHYRMTGHVQAEIEQVCGVTLDPVQQFIDEEFDVEFRRGALRDMDLKPDFDVLDADEPEPIEHGQINAGRFICEVVASVIDPFPRAADAELDRSEAGDAGERPNPFAVLQQLKR